VVEWKDLYKTDGFSIWKIESGRLLQKFDPVSKDNGFVHKSASIVSIFCHVFFGKYNIIIIRK